MNQKGQALIEAVFCFALITSVFIYFGGVTLIGGTQILLDSETDQITLCVASLERLACRENGLQALRVKAPWLIITSYRESTNLSPLGLKVASVQIHAESRFQTLSLEPNGGLNWSSIKFKAERTFKEQRMKKVSRY